MRLFNSMLHNVNFKSMQIIMITINSRVCDCEWIQKYMQKHEKSALKMFILFKPEKKNE